MRTRLSPLTAALLLASCGGGSSKPLTTDDFCTMKATTECQVTTRCVNDKDTCITTRKAACQQFVTANQTLPRVFTPANVGTCIGRTNTAYQHATGTTGMTPADMAAMDLACGYVFQGNVPPASACTTQFDCAGRTDGNRICDKGLCADKKTVNLNDLCANPGEVCNTGAYCTADGSVMRCLAKKGAAAACDPATMPCTEDLRCTGGICMTKVVAGGLCASNADCPAAAGYCDPFAGSICDTGLTFSPNSPSCAAFGGAAGGGNNDAAADTGATTSDGGDA